jgi:hypothetical protein
MICMMQSAALMGGNSALLRDGLPTAVIQQQVEPSHILNRQPKAVSRLGRIE